MAMAAALVATPFARATLCAALHPTAETSCSATRSATDRGSRGRILQQAMSSNFSSCCSSSGRGPVEPIACGLSSSGRDGGACSSLPRSTASNSSRNAVDFAWRVCSSGGLSAVPRTRNWTAVPRKMLPLRIFAEKPDLTNGGYAYLTCTWYMRFRFLWGQRNCQSTNVDRINEKSLETFFGQADRNKTDVAFFALPAVAGTILRVGKQGLEAGTNLVPASVPRPVAQAGVGLAGLFLASFLLKSLFSTVTFILAIGAVSYAGYYFLTKGETSSSSSKDGDGPSGKPKSGDDALEEARRIMEKYK